MTGRRIPAVAENTVFTGSHDGCVYALNVADRTERWRFKVGDAIASTPTVDGTSVYVGSHDASVYAIAIQDGTERWRFEIDDIVQGSDTIANNTVYGGAGIAPSIRWKRREGSISGGSRMVT
jgi:outer membrane protein assembly factor BamB